MNRLAVLAALVLLTIACNEGEQMTIEEVHATIREGIERTELEAFFETNGISYSVIEGDQLALDSDLPADPDQLSARYVAIIRDVGRWMLLYRESIVIRVDFGGDGKASQVKAYKSRTGIRPTDKSDSTKTVAYAVNGSPSSLFSAVRR